MQHDLNSLISNSTENGGHRARFARSTAGVWVSIVLQIPEERNKSVF